MPRWLWGRTLGLPAPPVPAPPESPTTTPHKDLPVEPPTLEEYGLVLTRRPRPPVWLKAQQARLGSITRQAAEETKHLRGPERAMAMNKRVAELMKGKRDEG